jgi:hypothetical protein
MPIRAFMPFAEDGDGLDFAEYWGDPVLVGATLEKIAAHLQPANCYCLRLHPVHGGKSWFEPYAVTGLFTDPDTPVQYVHVPYAHLLAEQDGREVWPILGEWVPGGPSLHPPHLHGAVWIRQIRVKSGTEYVGFIKAVAKRGPPPPDERVRDAFRQAKGLLHREISKRRLAKLWTDPAAQAALSQVHACIQADVDAGRRHAAIQRVATLVTSHLGSNFNRIACLDHCAAEDSLQCVYAHGGDCGASWSKKVQFQLASEVRTIEHLQDRVTLRIPPDDDPLYRDLVMEDPLRVSNVSSSHHLLARIWQQGGVLRGLSRNAIEDGFPDSMVGPYGGVVVSVDNLAAWLSLEDSWLADRRARRPGSALFGSKNGILFALPWSFGGRILSIWLLDLGYWSRFDLLDVVGKLRVARAILAEFAPHF